MRCSAHGALPELHALVRALAAEAPLANLAATAVKVAPEGVDCITLPGAGVADLRAQNELVHLIHHARGHLVPLLAPGHHGVAHLLAHPEG